MGEKKYYVCKMEEAKNGLGIVSEAYYNNDKSVKDHATNKKFKCEITFEGTITECLSYKKKKIKS